MRLAGKAAIITGSGDGIGRQIARAFARDGALVLVVDIKDEGVLETVRQIEAETEPGRAVALHQDIATADGVKTIVQTCVERFGRLDCIVNNAANQAHAKLEAITEEHWDAVQNVNVRASVLLAKEALPYLTQHSGGSIVNIASIRGEQSMSGGTAYDTSKAAVLGLTRALAVELGLRGIRVNAILPGHIMSFGEEVWKARMSEKAQAVMKASYALGRVGKPEEVASVAVFLASDDASFITGQSLLVDGGSSIMSSETAVFRAAELL